METIFWTSVAGIFYAYFGYPLILWLAGLLRAGAAVGRTWNADGQLPSVSLIVPVHNEAEIIKQKLENSLALVYPGEWEIVVVSDGSTDATSAIVNSFLPNDRLKYVEVADRAGKANALNVGVENAQGEIVIFSDASIMLEGNSLQEIVRPFQDPRIGCVSGEDKISNAAGEGLYGAYELFLRRRESAIGSIVGASGSFYAQRKALIKSFPAGVAPDFISVLNTVRMNFRAVSNPLAVGYMQAIDSSREEFSRKVRTVVRGMTALFENWRLADVFRFPKFSFMLLSHKVIRWLVPFFLGLALLSNALLFGQPFYAVILLLQVAFYSLAGLTVFLSDEREIPLVLRICTFLVASNLAILAAWGKYLLGFRQELWNPSKRTG